MRNMRARLLINDVLGVLWVAAVIAEFALLGPVSVWLFAAVALPTSWVFDHWHVKTLGLSRRTMVDRLRRPRHPQRRSYDRHLPPRGCGRHL